MGKDPSQVAEGHIARFQVDAVEGSVEFQAFQASLVLLRDLFLERPDGFARCACAILYTAPYIIRR